MKVRPVTRHWCDPCGEYHEGRLKDDPVNSPQFDIGCCFDLHWSGTREEAGKLYDYLVEQGYLKPATVSACGKTNATGESYNIDGDVWRCGMCGTEYPETAKAQAIACCANSAAATA